MTECACTPCASCRGDGTIPVLMGGSSMVVCSMDDLCDLVMCEDCDGSGYADECDSCLDQRMRDEAEEDPDDPAFSRRSQ